MRAKENPPLVESDHALPLVQLSIAAMPGAVLDPPGKEGLTRLTARLMRRTAHGLDANRVDEQLDSLGSSLGAEVGYSSVGFSGSVLRRSLGDYIEILRGVLNHPGFAASEFERLKRQTLAEIVEHRDDDRTLARMWFRRTLFENHPYGRGVVGTSQSVASLTLDDVRGAYDQISTHGAFTIALAGDVTEAEAKQITATLLGDRQRNEEPPTPSPEEVVPQGLRLLLVDKPERTQTQILIGGLGTHAHDPDHIALCVANTVFGGTFTARLTQAVRAERGWSYGAYSYLPIDRFRQAFSMWTFPAAADAAPCIELELKMLEEWVERGVSAEELLWAKRYLVRSHVFSSDTAAKRMSLTQEEVVLKLPPAYYAKFPEWVEAVTLEEVNAAIKRRISLKDLLIVVLGSEPDVGASVRGVVPRHAKVQVVSYDAE